MILIDCPPSLGVLTINGLTAATEVLIPLQCEALSHRGVGQLLETIDDVRMFANADLDVRGVIATMYDERTRHGKAVIDDVRARYGLSVLEPPVRKSIRSAEAPARGADLATRADVAGGRGLSRLARELRGPASGALNRAQRDRGRERLSRPVGQAGPVLGAGERSKRPSGRRTGPAKPLVSSPSRRSRGTPRSTECQARPLLAG